jgi:hypothetical protein
VGVPVGLRQRVCWPPDMRLPLCVTVCVALALLCGSAGVTACNSTLPSPCGPFGDCKVDTQRCECNTPRYEADGTPSNLAADPTCRYDMFETVRPCPHTRTRTPTLQGWLC